MRNGHLRQLLRELPRHGATEGFTQSVTRRLVRSDRRGDARWKLALLSAAATLAVTAGAAHLAIQHREQSRIEAFEQQRRQLQAEIAEIRDQTEFEAVIDIGQEDGIHYVLDLRPVEVQPVPPLAVQPTFY